MGAEICSVSAPGNMGERQRMSADELDPALQQCQNGILRYFLPRIASLAALATRNLTTRFAGILISSPV